MAPIVADLERRCASEAGTILRIDVEEPRGEALAARYGVRAIPTFVSVDAEGVEVERIVGVQSAARLSLALSEVRGRACPL